MKIKEGGVMDIELEKNDFEEAFEKNCGASSSQFERDELGFYEWRETLCGWHMWLEAKAQADQKIKLLLCDEHLKKCESPTGVFNSHYPDEEPCLICLAKEAKAQAVPEGYVLMPIKPTKTMVMAVVKEHEGDAFLPYSLYDAYVKQAMIEAQEPAND